MFRASLRKPEQSPPWRTNSPRLGLRLLREKITYFPDRVDDGTGPLYCSLTNKERHDEKANDANSPLWLGGDLP